MSFFKFVEQLVRTDASRAHLGNSLRMFRIRLRLSQKELCEILKGYRVQLDQSSLSRIERGEIPLSEDRLEAFCLALDCSTEELHALAKELSDLDASRIDEGEDSKGLLARMSSLVNDDYKRIIESIRGSGEVLWHYCYETKRFWASENFRALYGASEVSGEITSWWRLFSAIQLHRDDRKLICKTLARLIESGQDTSFDIRCRIMGASKRFVAVRIRGRVEIDERNRLKFAAGSVSQISENDFYASQAVKLMESCFVFAKNRNLEFTFVNDALAQALGRPKSEIIGLTDRHINPNESEVCFFNEQDLKVLNHTGDAANGEAVGSSRLAVAEEVLTDSLGNQHSLTTIKTKVVMPNGEIQMIGIATDTTDATLFAHGIEQMLAVTDDIYFTVDAASRFTFCNAAMLRFADHSKEELVNKAVREVFGADLALKLDSELSSILSGSCEHASFAVREHGTAIQWRLFNLYPLRDNRGKCIGAFGTASALTSNNIARIHLSKGSKLMFRLIDELAGVAWIQDERGRLVHGNKRFRHDYPTISEGVSLNAAASFGMSSQINPVIIEACERNTPMQMQLQVTTPNGGIRSKVFCCHPILDNSNCLVGSLCIVKQRQSDSRDELISSNMRSITNRLRDELARNDVSLLASD